MMNQSNKRMTALDPIVLYNNAKQENVQFYQYNDWIMKKGRQVLFEGMFLKKIENEVKRKTVKSTEANGFGQFKMERTLPNDSKMSTS